MLRSSSIAAATLLVLLSGGVAHAQSPQVVLDRDGGTIVLEPYAPNIVRVTLSLLKEPATAAPGYGFVASPSAQGWSRQQDAQGDVYRSPRLVVTVAANRPRKPMATELDIAKILQRVRSSRSHYDQHSRRQEARGDDGLVDVRAELTRTATPAC